jgi:ribosome assembly protein 1
MATLRREWTDRLKDLQTRPHNIRNICILAHVDHGKTTLADSLIASNDIISRRLAGKLRYMDDREDEQARGITMKSSSIALHYSEGDHAYLINLIDSPGHVDFSSEVSTAVRLCDGALIVIDVVEGVCPQTKVVLEQAWREGIKPCLVINKIDRLINGLKYTPIEAYKHIEHLLQQVNAVTATFWTVDILQQQADGHAHLVGGDEGDGDDDVDQLDDSHVYFSPEQGNVVFTSAIDGWGFSIEHFAHLYSQKLGFKLDVLRKTLWGDYYINSKTKRILKGAQNKGKKPLFVQLILDNLWTVYDAVLNKKDKAMINKITSSLGIKVSARDSTHTSPYVHLSSIFHQWLPLSQAILNMVVNHLPSPLSLTRDRVEHLLTPPDSTFNSLPLATQSLTQSFIECDPNGPLVVFISKMFSVDSSLLATEELKTLSLQEMKEKREEIIKNLKSDQPVTSEDTVTDGNEQEDGSEDAPPTSHTHTFLAFARVFSGTIRRGQKVYVLHPRYNPSNLDDPALLTTPPESAHDPLPQHVSVVDVGDLYLLMGRDLVKAESVAPGNVLGIAGLEDIVIKWGTLSITLSCPSFRPMGLVAHPIVRVAIEPIRYSDMSPLMDGLKLLNQSDPCVKLSVLDTGERVLATAGEVHLQRCLDDLRKLSGVEFQVSPPIISFRETVVAPPTVDMVNEVISSENEIVVTRDNKYGPITLQTMGPHPHSVTFLAQPLPQSIIDALEKHAHLLKLLTTPPGSALPQDTVDDLKDLYVQLVDGFGGAESNGAELVDHIWSFGPRQCGPNVLINGVKDYSRPSIWGVVDAAKEGGALREFDNSIISGFQLATLFGPLCEEPLHGVCLTLLEWTTPIDSSQSIEREESTGPVSGQLIHVTKEACRQAVLAQPTRLMLAMYSCIIQAATSVLSFVYAVIGRRNGRVLSEEMIEGSDLFIIHSVIPVAESFGFCDEFRKQTIGQANPQLFFSHWEVLSSDPFWVPSTDQELQHYGEKADIESQARIYMNSVRKRKGLPVDEKIVEHAEKQRTLKRNK